VTADVAGLTASSRSLKYLIQRKMGIKLDYKMNLLKSNGIKPYPLSVHKSRLTLVNRLTSQRYLAEYV